MYCTIGGFPKRPPSNNRAWHRGERKVLAVVLSKTNSEKESSLLSTFIITVQVPRDSTCIIYKISTDRNNFRFGLRM